MDQTASRHPVDLEQHGIRFPDGVLRNAPTPVLYEATIRAGLGTLGPAGQLVVRTGACTGRSPHDRFIVRDPGVADAVDWGESNQPLDPERYVVLRHRLLAYLERRQLYVEDACVGADARHTLRARVVTESPWHALFARTMLRRLDEDQLAGFEPEWVVLHAPFFHANPVIDGTRSGTFVVLNLTEKTILIGGTEYAGEIKKALFTVLNYLLTDRGVLPMHCSANRSRETGDVALFFGLSGTGKTTLSADTARILIGDDEHGWSPDGVFNFEGGCYAKVIRLSRDAEPEIWEASHRFGAILENVVCDPQSRAIDLDDARYTENTRCAYPIEHIPNADPDGRGGVPRQVIFLTCDAFGVLPPIARLSAPQAALHFLCGYTAKVAGTERGVREPKATFSACFGAPFMPRNPTVYASMLRDHLEETGASCWLVNTGWTGGGYGVGKRISLRHTRALVDAVLHGDLDDAPMRAPGVFRLAVPEAVPGVPKELLDPRSTWADPAAYDLAVAHLATRFEETFSRFAATAEEDVRAALWRPA